MSRLSHGRCRSSFDYCLEFGSEFEGLITAYDSVLHLKIEGRCPGFLEVYVYMYIPGDHFIF